MTTSQSPITTSDPSAKPGSPRRGRYFLTGLAIFTATIALFYAEEDWRGHRAWARCKRELEAKGAVLDWAAFMAPPVPEEQNAFAVPEMQQWFTGRAPTNLSAQLGWPGETELSKILNYPGYTNTLRVVAAHVTIGLPWATPPSGFTALHWWDGANAQAEAARLIREALGPMGMDPSGYGILAKRPQEVRPAQIFLQCQAAPSVKELEQFFPKDLFPKQGWHNPSENMRVEPTGGNSYQVIMFGFVSAADFVAWGESIAPKIAIIRQAVQRPSSRLEGDLRDLRDMPIENFVSMRIISQRLAALAGCHMLLGQPEKALEDLTLLHQVRRILELRPTGKPMTLVMAMINVAISGLYEAWVEEGIRLQVWKEPQLAALQEQLGEIHLRPLLAESMAFERAGMIRTVEIAPRKDLGHFFWPLVDQKTNAVKFALIRLIPQGWVDQNLVVLANLEQEMMDCLPREGQAIEPQRIEAWRKTLDATLTNRSPFNLLAAGQIPNYNRSAMTLAHNQTKVNQARMACALERYRLAHGEYPSTLEALTPQFMDKIPLDLIGGQPPHYRRTDDGKFLLYSIGWSETDHGGQSGSAWKGGDWVLGDE